MMELRCPSINVAMPSQPSRPAVALTFDLQNLSRYQ